MRSVPQWLQLLTTPQQATQALRRDPHLQPRLATLLGLYLLATIAYNLSVAPSPNPSVVLGSFIALFVGVYIYATLSWLAARLLKGQGTWRDQQLAFLWGQLPNMISSTLIAALALLLQMLTGQTLPESIEILLGGVALLWCIWTTTYTMAEVNRFSVGRGLIIAMMIFGFGFAGYFM